LIAIALAAWRLEVAFCIVSSALSIAMLLDAFRARFPLLARRVYVNSCSQGALSTDVEAAMMAFTESWHEAGSPWERWVGEMERLRTTFAAFIGADADEVAIMPSASAAIAAIATALPFHPPRTTVILGEFEFPTMGHVWLAQQARGASVRWVKAEGDTLPAERYEAIVDEQTAIVPVTHVCFRNGYRLDVGRIVEMCHARGAYCLLDDYQHTGTAPLDVHALGVDFMVTGALKYLLGPSGVAFLYVRRDLVGRFEPLVTGWFGRREPFAFDPSRLDWSSTARRFEAGTPPIPNIYAAAAGLALLERTGLAAIQQQIAALVERFHRGARERGLAVVTPDDPHRRGPLVVVRRDDASALVERLSGRGIIASARGNGVRVSFHGYNNGADVDEVLDALS
jgi:selenocysteine lyase/cysteine desulfurase